MSRTVKSLAEKRLDMSPDKALEWLRYMQFDVAHVESELDDEQADLLIEIDDDPSVAEGVRDKRTKELEKARKKNERLQAAKKAAASKKKPVEEVAEPAAEDADAADKASKKHAVAKKATDEAVVAEIEEPVAVESQEVVAPVEAEVVAIPESPAAIDEPHAETEEVSVEAAVVSVVPEPVEAEAEAIAEVIPAAPVEETPKPEAKKAVEVKADAHPTGKPYAAILTPEDEEEIAARNRKKAAKASAEILPSEATSEDGKQVLPLTEGNMEAAFELAMRRTESELGESVQRVDHDVVREVLRREAERQAIKARKVARQAAVDAGGDRPAAGRTKPGEKPAAPGAKAGAGAEKAGAAKTTETTTTAPPKPGDRFERPGGRPAGRGDKEERSDKGVKLEKVSKIERLDRTHLQAVDEDETPVVRRSNASTGKTARKRMKKAEKARLEETMRRNAAAAVREYQALSGAIGSTKKRKRRRDRDEDADADDISDEPIVLEVGDSLTVEQLAEAMEIGVNDIILALMDENILVNKNQVLDMDIIRRLGEANGFEIRAIIPEEIEVLAEDPDPPESLVHRAPVVTVMGHVDHGKTTLLDKVRKANVAATEAGGITQHIAAYEVQLPEGRVVFLDTPGHEAFTQLRARGAQVTDVVVLVVAADDGVMPQTIEAINHARAANVPIVVAINKCDKPDAQPDRIRQELTRFDLVDEQWGGSTSMRNISAKNNVGVDELIELLVLESQMLELKANPNKRARGTVVEAEFARGLGPVAWVLVQGGTLRVGDFFLAGETFGRVRLLQNSRGENIEVAGPATPVVVTGFETLPQAGDTFVVVQDERAAKVIAEKRTELNRQKQGGPAAHHMTLEDFHARMLAGEKRELNIVVKADVNGSIEVLRASLAKVGNDEVHANVIHAGVGGINESDVLLASASDAVIIGFHVTASPKAQKLAEQEGVEIRSYRVIYELIDNVKAALEGMLSPDKKETITGHASVRAVFRSSQYGNIAGCYVTDGEILRGSPVRLLRDSVVVYEGKIGSIRRNKEDVRVVLTDFECGIKLDNFEDVKDGDIIEVYKIESVAKLLE